MGLKANIRQELEDGISDLLKTVGAKNKTDFVNKAVEDYSKRVKRQKIVAELNQYFANPKYQKAAKERMDDFSRIRYLSD